MLPKKLINAFLEDESRQPEGFDARLVDRENIGRVAELNEFDFLDDCELISDQLLGNNRPVRLDSDR